MRIDIREQLGAVIILVAIIPLLILSLAIYIVNFRFVTSVTAKDLSLTASLKAAQMTSDLILIQRTCQIITTKIILQNSLRSYYHSNGNSQDWSEVLYDIAGGLTSSGSTELLQLIIFLSNATSKLDRLWLMRFTADRPGITLPSIFANLTHAMLGDNSTLGYPTALYPNITHALSDTFRPLDPLANLLLTLLQINQSYAHLSFTFLFIDTRQDNSLLGYMTVVAAASRVLNVMQSRDGLAQTGIALLVGPSQRDNKFNFTKNLANATDAPNLADISQSKVDYVFPPIHFSGTDSHTAAVSRRPQWIQKKGVIDSSGGIPITSNENGVQVAIGYARLQTTLVDWLLIIDQSHAEAWTPIIRLRNIVLSCMFASLGLVIVMVFPMAYMGVLTIRRLWDATKKSITPLGYSSNASIILHEAGDNSDDESTDIEKNWTLKRLKERITSRLRYLRPGLNQNTLSEFEHVEETRRRIFKIPGKVQNHPYFITDKLTELTTTFNQMAEELLLQHTNLEQKVAERTFELEIRKKAAEAANESKTLFIANILHELKTPLNRILGICAVCMADNDLNRIQRNLQILYKSGDILLNLLNDLLTFTKNQIGQELTLEEKFRLVDIETQILTIFTNDPEISGSDVKSSPFWDQPGKCTLKDISLLGDQPHILQIIINLVSNSLKFVPEGGKVELRIKYLGEADTSAFGGGHLISIKHASISASNTSQSSQNRLNLTSAPGGTALHVNSMYPKVTAPISFNDSSPAMPPKKSRRLILHFEVEDTGAGIPSALQDKVFEPFVQGDLGLSRKLGGTGLGLSICSQLATLMGGSITFDSIEGIGTTFKLFIPLKYTKSRSPSTSNLEDIHRSISRSIDSGNRPSIPKTVSESGPSAGFQKATEQRLVGLSQPFLSANLPSPSTSALGKQSKDNVALIAGLFYEDMHSRFRVLVADDNIVNQQVVRRMVKLEDIYDVQLVKDGQEVYEVVKESMSRGQLFDLIFMDIQMLNLDGLQNTRHIREIGYPAPIVALTTAYSVESNIQECYNSGMDIFMSKPLRRPALKQVLKKFGTIPEETETGLSGGTTTSSAHPSGADLLLRKPAELKKKKTTLK